MRLFGSITFAVTGIEIPYISQSHRTCFPASSLPLLLVNQNFVVISGSTKAQNTSATGLRMSMPVLVIGTCVRCRLFILSLRGGYGRCGRTDARGRARICAGSLLGLLDQRTPPARMVPACLTSTEGSGRSGTVERGDGCRGRVLKRCRAGRQQLGVIARLLSEAPRGFVFDQRAFVVEVLQHAATVSKACLDEMRSPL